MMVDFSEAQGHESEDDQEAILQECLQVFRERNRIYQDAWRQGKLQGNLNMIDHKLMRVKSLAISEDPDAREKIQDDLVDLINYAAFSLRIIREG